MDTVQQDAFAMKELLDEGGEGLTGLAVTYNFLRTLTAA